MGTTIANYKITAILFSFLIITYFILFFLSEILQYSQATHICATKSYMWHDEECFTNSLFSRYLMSFIYLFQYFLILLIIVTFYEHRKVKYKTFFSWIDQILSNKLPNGIVAFNFNLYEGKDSYHIQLIGASSFSETNSDWPCDELFSTGEDVFVVETKLAGSHWQDALSYCKKMISDYLKFEQKRNVLLSSKAVGMGLPTEI